MQHKTRDHVGGDCCNDSDRTALSQQNSFHTNEMRINKTVCGLQHVWLRNCKLYSNVRAEILLCVRVDALRHMVQRIVAAVIQDAYVLSAF
jgi:hypothetical protein